MLNEILFLLLGLALLIKFADWFVDGASSLAKKMNVSEAVIGLTVVAFGTSAPELVVNVLGSIKQDCGITFGNIVGSNISNILLILGIAGLIRPIATSHATVWKEIPFSFLAVLALFGLANDQLWGAQLNILSKYDGIILLLFFGYFLVYAIRLGKKSTTPPNAIQMFGIPRTSLYLIGGLVGLVIGGYLVVENAKLIAAHMGMSQKFIGLTIVAIGTSLPELATSAMAAFKGKDDIAMGNIIGSNIFNIFFIMGISTCISPIAFTGYHGLTIHCANIDLGVLFAATVLLFITMFSGKKSTLDRWEAAILVIGYVAYTAFLIYQQ